MRKFLIIAALGAVSAFLLFLVCLVLVPAIGGLLFWPGFRATKALGISEDGANLAVGIAIAWMIWAAVFAATIAVIKHTLWRRRELFLICTIVVVAVLFFQARGSRNKEYDGTWEFGDERSAFYSGGGCWRLPYWLEPTSELSGPSGKLEALGNPSRRQAQVHR